MDSKMIFMKLVYCFAPGGRVHAVFLFLLFCAILSVQPPSGRVQKKEENTMFETFTELLTRDNVTLALSIFGSLGTLITLITNFLVYRKNLKIHISDAFYLSDRKLLYIKVLFENRSRLPISITKISLSINKEIFTPTKLTHCVHDYKNKDGEEIVDRIFTYNSQLPKMISALGAECGYIIFDIPEEVMQNLSTPLSYSIYSTRPGVQRIELPYTEIRCSQTPHNP